MKKVLYLSAVGEVAYTRTVLLLHVFAGEGYVVGAICPGDRPKASNDVAFRHCRVRRPAANFWYNRGLANTIRALVDRAIGSLQVAGYLLLERPDVIVCSEPDCWWLGYLYKHAFGCTLIADVREVYEDRALAFPLVMQTSMRRLIRWCMKVVAKSTDAILHVSEERQAVYQFLGVQSDVVACYPEVCGFSGSEEQRGLRRMRDTDTVTAIHVGALRSTYAADELLLAVEELANEGVPLRLLVLGGVAGRIRENELLVRLQKCKIVELCEQVPFAEVRRRMGYAHIGISLVLPVDTAHRLAQPQKLYEYLAAGLPVVGANVPTIRRVLEVYECGIAVNAERPRAIAAALRYLATDGHLRRVMGAKGRRAAECEFNWTRERTRLVAIIRRTTGLRVREKPAI